MIPLVLIPVVLIPLDIPTNGTREATPFGVLPLLLIVLVALVVMVGLLFFLRSRRNKQ